MVVRSDLVEARDALVSRGKHVLTHEEKSETGLPLAGPAAKGVPVRSDPNPNPNPNPSPSPSPNPYPNPYPNPKGGKPSPEGGKP